MHYGILPRNARAGTFVVIEFSRLCILYAICLYYCAKASGLLKKRRLIIALLSVFFCGGALVMLGLGIWVGALIWDGRVGAAGLCTHWQYQTWQGASIAICFVFIFAFFKIRRGILDHPRETHLDHCVLKF